MTDTKEIEIRIKSVEQLFNSFDPSPFRERELDREAERHIVSYAREIADGSPFELVIYLPPATIVPTLDEKLAAAIGHHFELRAREQEIELNELRRLGRKGLVVGLLVMLFATLAGIALTNAFPKSSFFETIEQSLIIFAWGWAQGLLPPFSAQEARHLGLAWPSALLTCFALGMLASRSAFGLLGRGMAPLRPLPTHPTRPPARARRRSAASPRRTPPSRRTTWTRSCR